MDTATGYSAPIHAWFELLVEIRELEEAGLVAVSIDDGAEFELNSRAGATNTWVAIPKDMGSMHRWNGAESRP